MIRTSDSCRATSLPTRTIPTGHQFFLPSPLWTTMDWTLKKDTRKWTKRSSSHGSKAPKYRRCLGGGQEGPVMPSFRRYRLGTVPVIQASDPHLDLDGSGTLQHHLGRTRPAQLRDAAQTACTGRRRPEGILQKSLVFTRYPEDS